MQQTTIRTLNVTTTAMKAIWKERRTSGLYRGNEHEYAPPGEPSISGTWPVLMCILVLGEKSLKGNGSDARFISVVLFLLGWIREAFTFKEGEMAVWWACCWHAVSVLLRKCPSCMNYGRVPERNKSSYHCPVYQSIVIVYHHHPHYPPSCIIDIPRLYQPSSAHQAK